MKKVLLSVAILATTMFVACGPSAEEIAKKEKATQDSIAAADAEKAKQDSIAMAEEKAKADAMAAEAAAKATADSLAKAEEEAKAKKGHAAPKKSVEQKVKEEVKKVTRGKG